MKAVILDGSAANDAAGRQVRETLAAQLQERGWNTEEIILRDRKIGACAGDFFCWVRSPGMCMLDDDNRDISRQVMSGDLLVYLTPVTFGGYSSVLKSMVDHLIQNISPYFQSVNGETHHKQRYKTYPDLMTVGWTDGPDPRTEAIFRYLTTRNSINFFSRKHYCGVLTKDQADAEAGTMIRRWLDDIENGKPSPPVTVTEIDKLLMPAGNGDAGAPQRALLLVGSPRTQKSVSHALGQHLFQRLATQGVQTDTVFLHTAVRSPETMAALLKTIDAADVITLAFPLYVDSLPAPVITALENIRDHRRNGFPDRQQMFCAIGNCGFPEPVHNTSALGICAAFSRQTGFAWAGSLSLGGGGMLSGRPLAEEGGRTARIRTALELAADALSRGMNIPPEAQALLSKPVIPTWAYRLMGGFGWKSMAKKYGVRKELDGKPYSK